MDQTVLINLKAKASERERWKAALATEGREMSAVCREALERATRRIEKKLEDKT